MPKGLHNTIIFESPARTWRFMQAFKNRFEY